MYKDFTTDTVMIYRVSCSKTQWLYKDFTTDTVIYRENSKHRLYKDFTTDTVMIYREKL